MANQGKKGPQSKATSGAKLSNQQTGLRTKSLLDFVRPRRELELEVDSQNAKTTLKSTLKSTTRNTTKSTQNNTTKSTRIKKQTKTKLESTKNGSSNEKNEHDLVDLLSSDDDSSLPASQTGSKKRTRMHTTTPLEPFADSNGINASESTTKRIKTSKDAQSSKMPVSRQSWVDKYEPLTASQVAVHNKKLEEIRKIMTEMLSGTSFTKILILSGPSGASKSATVKAVARDLGVHISSSEDPNTLASSSSSPVDYVEWQNPDKTENIPLPEAFSDFLNGLTFGVNVKLILIEDLPNLTHFETKQLFNNALLQWICNPRKLPPIVICFTEIQIIGTRDYTSSNRGEPSYVHNDSWVVERMFNRQLLEDYRVKRIKMLPVNATLITKTLKNIAQNEKEVFSALNKKEVDATIKNLAGTGDVRSAIGTFEFWACWNCNRNSSSHIVPSSKNDVLDIFHAVGRILHGSKLMEDEPAIESVVLDWCDSNTDGSFNSALFENYLSAKSCAMDLDSISKCADCLSDSMLLTAANADITTEVACRGLRTIINHSQTVEGAAQRGFRPLAFPSDRRMGLKRLETSAEYVQYALDQAVKTGTLLSHADVILYNGFYESQMKNSSRRRRVGGSIKSETVSFAGRDDELEDDEDENVDVFGSAYVRRSDEVPASPKGYLFSDDDIESD